MSKLKVCVLQIQTGSDSKKNLAKVEDYISRAAASYNPHLIALPEVINFRGDPKDEKNHSEKIEPGNPFFDSISKLAKKFSVSIMAGSVLETNEKDPEKPLNTAFYIDSKGKLLSKYSKIHLFDVDIGRVITESNSRSRGDIQENNLKIFTDEFININDREKKITDRFTVNMSMAICYDLRFPELFRSFFFDKNHNAQKSETVYEDMAINQPSKFKAKIPDIIFLPSAFSKPTGMAHWEALLRARAIENTVCIIAPNQVGMSVSSFECHGHSMVVGPWGEIIAEADGVREDILMTEINLSEINEARHRLPLENARLF